MKVFIYLGHGIASNCIELNLFCNIEGAAQMLNAGVSSWHSLEWKMQHVEATKHLQHYRTSLAECDYHYLECHYSPRTSMEVKVYRCPINTGNLDCFQQWYSSGFCCDRCTLRSLLFGVPPINLFQGGNTILSVSLVDLLYHVFTLSCICIKGITSHSGPSLLDFCHTNHCECLQ